MAVAACVLATAFVPVGCGGGDNSNNGPTPIPTVTGPTPTPSPIPTPTVLTTTIASSVTSPAGFDIGASDGGFLIAYGAAATATNGAIYGVRLGANGSVLDASPFLVSVAQADGYLSDPSWTSPAVGYDGTSFAVAYAGTGTAQGVPANAITAVLVDAQKNVGAPTDLAETAQIGTCQSAVGPPPTIAGAPSTLFAAVWPVQEGCAGGPVLDLLGAAFATPDGAALAVTAIDGLLPPVDPNPIVSSAASIATTPTTIVAAWTEAAAGSSSTNVELALLAASGVERVQLATGVDGFVRPAIASDDSNEYLVVWQGSGNSIRGGRFRPGTGPLDGADGFLIAQGGQQPLGAPRVAFGNAGYLVAWVAPGGSGSSLEAIRVTPLGTLFGDLLTIVPAGGIATNDVALAFSRQTYVATYLGPASGGGMSLDATTIGF